MHMRSPASVSSVNSRSIDDVKDEEKDSHAALPSSRLPFIVAPAPDLLLLTWETEAKEAVQQFLQRAKREIAIPYQLLSAKFNLIQNGNGCLT